MLEADQRLKQSSDQPGEPERARCHHQAEARLAAIDNWAMDIIGRGFFKVAAAVVPTFITVAPGQDKRELGCAVAVPGQFGAGGELQETGGSARANR